MRNLILSFIVFLLALSIGTSQDNYVLLSDPTGIDRLSYEQNLELKTKDITSYIESVNEGLGTSLAKDFKVYDFGAYLHNTTQLSLPEIKDISRAMTSTNNRLIFNKISDHNEIWSEVDIELDLDIQLLDCYDNDYIQSELIAQFEAYYDDSHDFEKACSKTIDRLLDLLKEVICCYLNDDSKKKLKTVTGLECEEAPLEEIKDDIFLKTKFFSNNFISNTGTILNFPTLPEKVWFNGSGTVRQFMINDDLYRGCQYKSDPTKSAGYRKEKCSHPSIPLYEFGKPWKEGDVASVNVGKVKPNCINQIFKLDFAAKHDDLEADGGFNATIDSNLEFDFKVTYEKLATQGGLDMFANQEYIPKYEDSPLYSIIDYTEDNSYPCPKANIPFQKLGPYSYTKIKLIPAEDGFWQPTQYGWIFYYETPEEFNSYDFWVYNPQQNNFISFRPEGLDWQAQSEFTKSLINEMQKAITDIDTYIYLAEGVAIGAAVVGSAPVSITAGLVAGSLYLYKGEVGNAILAATFVGAEALMIYKNGKYFLKLVNIYKVLKNGNKATVKAIELSDNIKTLVKNFGFESEKVAKLFLKEVLENPALREAIEEGGEGVLKAYQKLKEIPNLRISKQSLKTVGKFMDDGVELSFEAIEGGAKIVGNNGDEVGKLVKNGSDEFLEISDDLFVEGGDAKSFNSITIKGNTGESFISPGYVINSDGTLGFVEDVASYGSELVRTTIKRRGKLRGNLPGIAKSEDAHHIFPVQTLKENQWVKKGVEGGYKFNDVANGMPIEKFVKATGKGRHGPHPKLTKQMSDHMDWWANQEVNGILNGSLSPQQTADYMNSIANTVKNKINSTVTKLNDLDLGLPH